MRDPGGPVLVRGRGNVDGRHKDGEQSGRESRKHDVSRWWASGAGYTYVDAARLALRAATSSNEPRRDERQRESPVDGAPTEKEGPQEEIRDDSHPGRVREREREERERREEREERGEREREKRERERERERERTPIHVRYVRYTLLFQSKQTIDRESLFLSFFLSFLLFFSLSESRSIWQTARRPGIRGQRIQVHF